MTAPGDAGEAAQLVWYETQAAAALCEQILTGPVAWWPQRLHKTHGANTLGMARELLRRMPGMIRKRPEGALQLTAMAILVADALEPDHYPRAMVARARAQARNDRASALTFLCRLPEALDAIENAERAFADVPAADYELARLMLVKAAALRMQDRAAEAIPLVRGAARTFLLFRDRTRHLMAKITEAAVLHTCGRYEEAIALSRSLQDDPGLDPVLRVTLAHNIAVCLCELGRRAEAIAPLVHAVAEFERLGLTTEKTRARWYLGNALLATGRHDLAILSLRAAWDELVEARLMADGALAALDLAEALLVAGTPWQVPMICRLAISQLTSAGMAHRALPALALLREAAELGRVTHAEIREARAVVGRAQRVNRHGTA